jgi:hypothetical protein
MTYTLNVRFNPCDLKIIQKAEEKVVLIKVVSNGQYELAWVAFNPFQQNQVSWDDSYYVFASNTEPVKRKQIIVNSYQSAHSQYEYQCSGNLLFSDGQYNSQLGEGEYKIRNQITYDPKLPWATFGMAQTCTVNSEEKKIMPINAEFTLALQYGIFTPTQTIWAFLSSDIQESAVYDNVNNLSQRSCADAESIATELLFSPDKQTIAVEYSMNQGKFIIAA